MGEIDDKEVEQLAINVIRGIAMDAPRRANSGHPGTAMALAPLAHVLWTKIMKHDPQSPEWPDRDRFILSAGHASILLYTMLHLSGYPLSIEDLKAFRQWGSLTPGHPEARHTVGVEVTTGPLGQGLGNSVGMAIAEEWLRARFGAAAFNHYTFTICSDGDFEEGLSHEAASLAGHLGLGHLICVYDDNHITIDGPTEITYTDVVAERFRSYNWHVEDLGDVANDTTAIEEALREAMKIEDQPSLLILRTHIGWPSPHLTDTSAAHGEPFPKEEIVETKKLLGLPIDQEFYVPNKVIDHYRQSIEGLGRKARLEWQERSINNFGLSPTDSAELEACLSGKLPPGWHTLLPTFQPGEKIATRQSINRVINASHSAIPCMLAGSADLTGNTGVKLEGAKLFSKEDRTGTQLAYGIREHAMGAAMCGMAMHGGILPIGGTFFVFSDYMRPSVRTAALSQAHVIYFWTHDSIGLGEDGPTHQPIEQLAAMRAMPGLIVIRPADANESAQAWRYAVEARNPVALVLSRQPIEVLAQTASNEGLFSGGYVLIDEDHQRDLDIVLVATGSEVAPCVHARELLSSKGINCRVVSMPSFELFEMKDKDYQLRILPEGVPKLGVEAASSFGWDRYVDATVCIDQFGASAPGEINMEKFGFSADNIAARAVRLIEQYHHRSSSNTRVQS